MNAFTALPTLTRRPASVAEVMAAVADHYRLSIGDLVGPKATRIHAGPRQLGMWIAYILCGHSILSIARAIGRTYGPVRKGIDAVTLRLSDPVLRSDATKIITLMVSQGMKV